MRRSFSPDKAILLAAGLGTRMRPLSYAIPKPLLPIWGTANIDRMIAMLASWGVTEFLVNVHHAPEALFSHLRRMALKEGVRITLSFEPEILGTGGALARAHWFLNKTPFWMVNTDIVASLSPEPFINTLHKRTAAAALWVTDTAGPRTVEVDRQSITNFRSKHAGRPGTFTFCGLQLIAPALIPYIRKTGFSTIISAYEAAIKDGKTVLGIQSPGSVWMDAGRPEQFLEAHKLLLQSGDVAAGRSHKKSLARVRRAGATAKGIVCVSPEAKLSGAASLENTVVMKGAVLGNRVNLSDVIVAPGVSINRKLHGGILCKADGLPQDELSDALLSSVGLQRESTIVHALPGRGSDRNFTRLISGRRSVMLVRYGTERPENMRYAAHARRLKKARIRVPRIIKDCSKERWTVFEDVGELSLLEKAQGMGPLACFNIYQRVLNEVIRLHALPHRPWRGKLEPRFDKSLYAWEHDLFDQHFLSDVVGISTEQRKAIRRELRMVSSQLNELPHVLVHRDLQSSNILLHRGQPVIIDFQGMRLGPAVYDLASLLCDPYVMLGEELQIKLLDYYACNTRQRGVNEEGFWLASIQRLCQALGAYGRLSAIPGAERFSASIPPALRMLQRAMTHADLATPALQDLATSACNSFGVRRSESPL